MRRYNSIEEIALDLKKADLQRQIAKEELKLKYNTIGAKLAKSFAANTIVTLGKTALTRLIVKRFLK